MTFLKINNLSVDYQMRKETVYAAKNVNIEVNKGEILGLVGESGSGKSTVGNAIINLIDEPGKVSSGSVILGDLNIHENSERLGNDFLFSGEWWITFFPAIFLVILAFSINLLGDWMRDTLNPELKK